MEENNIEEEEEEEVEEEEEEEEERPSQVLVIIVFICLFIFIFLGIPWITRSKKHKYFSKSKTNFDNFPFSPQYYQSNNHYQQKLLSPPLWLGWQPITIANQLNSNFLRSSNSCPVCDERLAENEEKEEEELHMSTL